MAAGSRPKRVTFFDQGVGLAAGAPLSFFTTFLLMRLTNLGFGKVTRPSRRPHSEVGSPSIRPGTEIAGGGSMKQSAGQVLADGDGEALWFGSSLVVFKATSKQTNGAFVILEPTAPRGNGTPLHVHEREDGDDLRPRRRAGRLCRRDRAPRRPGYDRRQPAGRAPRLSSRLREGAPPLLFHTGDRLGDLLPRGGRPCGQPAASGWARPSISAGVGGRRETT